MTKNKLVTVKVTYPVQYGERLIQAGETATVPAELADEWKLSERAVDVAAEVKHANRQNS